MYCVDFEPSCEGSADKMKSVLEEAWVLYFVMYT